MKAGIFPTSRLQTPTVSFEKMKKTLVDVSGEYLQMVVAHAKDILNRCFGNALQTMDLQYILAVSAAWSHKAKDATLRAACSAGSPRSNLFLISEPEVAAVCALRTIQPISMTVSSEITWSLSSNFHNSLEWRFPHCVRRWREL